MAKKQAYDLPEKFHDFAMMPKFNDDIDALSNLAEDEDWEYRYTSSTQSKPILRNYIVHTYQRIAEEKRFLLLLMRVFVAGTQVLLRQRKSRYICC